MAPRASSSSVVVTQKEYASIIDNLDTRIHTHKYLDQYVATEHSNCCKRSRRNSRKFSGCEINIKDYLGLDKLTYIDLESAVLTDWELLHGTTGATTIDLSNNPLMNIQRFDISVNTQLRKLMLANADRDEIDINISLPGNVSLM
ncbi:hypothetical protein GJ496_000489 [Pomphorhynchus laevis]|nr:hypothetical protein GJ496_000489 [Pomphorhynchus laevis]